MELGEYDQYIPEKELSMNFRIPRKRTAEESFGIEAGYSGETSRFGGNAPNLSAYGSLSSAASRASNYSNYRGAVSYRMPEKCLPALDKPIIPPLISTNQKTSFGSPQFYNRSSNDDEYRKRLMYDNENQAGPKLGPPWLGDSRNSSFSREGRIQGQNGGFTDRSWLQHNSNRNVPTLLGGGTEVIGPNGEVLGERRSLLPKPPLWNTRNIAGDSFPGSDRFSGRYDVGNTANQKFDDGSTFKERYNGGNTFEKRFNDDNSFHTRYNDGDRFKNSFNDGNRFEKSFNDGQKYNGGNNFSGPGNGNGGFSKKFNSGPGGFIRRGFQSEDNTNFRGEGANRGKFNNASKNAKSWNKPERPKTFKPYTPPVVIPDVTDKTLPEELRQMFQPLFCKLCSIQMTSNIMAKVHYVSKNHEKKIRKFLIEHSEKTGEPLHPRATVTATQEKKEKEEDKDPKNFYCDICDLKLTGKQHADSHYMGKSHNAVRMGKKKPHGKGFMDSSGKWTRVSNESNSGVANGDDTFGMDFRKKEAGENAESAPKPATLSAQKFTCSLCIVSCVSEEQLNIHLSGSKHKKKLRLKGLSPNNFTLPEDQDKQNAEKEDAAPSVDIDESLKGKYMTPNGFFYCETCNLSVNSEIQFKQHLASKKHANKMAEKKQQQNSAA